MTETRPVLVATEQNDVTADMVITELNQRGTPVVRFNPADLAAGELTVSAHFGTCPAPIVGRVSTPSRTTALTHVRSVYWRRPFWPVYEHLDGEDARYATAQTRSGLTGILYALDGSHWVNHPLRETAADYKPEQLATAQRLGLTIPPTLVTNDPDEARAFITRHGKVITKTLRWTPYAREGVAMTSWAEPVTADEITDAVAACPHLFQAAVDKTADVRVLIVGRHLFAVRITSGLLDWRKDYSALAYDVIDLPAPLADALHACLAHYGLVSGSFDLAIDQDGAYHWLELNPTGQWGWLEEKTGLPMAAAFADLLTHGKTA
ncbi:ATP-grasp ribosomal peptide maturase [Streptomyces sp. gCLA4]|uniref:ATP-grasp ribosomal peptide maturase n=1 Tax=Streptomyces sp. gCLA4 TaxID=1873416 RepID=UPI0016013B55|nr:ATP-grasp ribosomal peptide maturase [Streptomyces sp. gCLA4]